MKPSLFCILEDKRWEDIKGNHSDEICEALKELLMDTPAVAKPNDIGYLQFCYHRMKWLESKLMEIAEPYIEDLAEELGEVAYMDSYIDEVL